LRDARVRKIATSRLAPRLESIAESVPAALQVLSKGCARPPALAARVASRASEVSGIRR
jgi:hypothetical protein